MRTPGGLATVAINATNEDDALAEIGEQFDRLWSVLSPEWQAQTEWTMRCADSGSGVESDEQISTDQKEGS
jgi:hypothetical protein